MTEPGGKASKSVGLRMAKADQADFDTTYRLHNILRAAYEADLLPNTPDDEYEELDPDKYEDLRKFFDMLMDAFDKNQSGMMRVVGAASTVLYDKNEMVDPDKSYIDLHPRFYEAERQLDEAKMLIKLLHAWHWMPATGPKAAEITDHPLWPTNKGAGINRVKPLWDHVEQLIHKWGQP